jgi:hypothetical protein
MEKKKKTKKRVVAVELKALFLTGASETNEMVRTGPAEVDGEALDGEGPADETTGERGDVEVVKVGARRNGQVGGQRRVVGHHDQRRQEAHHQSH